MLTWWPGLSPFEFPVAGAWSCIGLVHFWALVSDQRSPLRTGILQWARVDAQRWFELRRVWGVFTLTATHFVVLIALRQWDVEPRAMALLLAGLSTVVLHQGLIRGSAGYLVLAGAELLTALHADFVVDSYIDRNVIIWIVFGIWAGLLILQGVVATMLPALRMAGSGLLAAAFTGVSFAHLLYHRPWSDTGLWAAVILAGLGVMTPRNSRHAQTGEERLAAALPLLLPAWLVYLSQADFANLGPGAGLRSWPLLTTTITILATGGVAAWFQVGALATLQPT